MLCVVGFSGDEVKSSSPVSTHRGVRRQRSLLSESLRSTSSSMVSMSRAASCESMGSGELVGSWGTASSESEEVPACQPGCADVSSQTSISIPYTRSVRPVFDCSGCLRLGLLFLHACGAACVSPEHSKQKAQSSSKIVHILWVKYVQCGDHGMITLLSVFVLVVCCGGVLATLNAT
jgi:hypothetical protein